MIARQTNSVINSFNQKLLSKFPRIKKLYKDGIEVITAIEIPVSELDILILKPQDR